MKLVLDGILVVEGKEDASYLSNYISSEIVVLNGYETNKDTIAYLKNKKIILLLDPDEAGQNIRKKLNQLLPNGINVEIDINRCNRGKKTGVAECQIDEILSKLHKYVKQEKEQDNDIRIPDLYNLGLMNDKSLRNKVCQKLNLGVCNAKQLFKRLNANSITLSQLCEIIKEQ